jgi:hypothetical protein
MKISLTFKSPDVIDSALQDHFGDGELTDEQQNNKDAAITFIKRYVKYDEYVTIEFDFEKETVVVKERNG